jgi:ribosomal protein S18 acetylase RimI-like enzyme
MMQVADQRTPSQEPPRTPFLLYGSTTCRVQRWSYRPHTAHMVCYLQRAAPTADDLLRWGEAMAAVGFTAVRTSVMSGPTADLLESAGFHVLQELALLENGRVRESAAALVTAAGRTERLSPRRLGRAAQIDLAAFGREWALDDNALHDVCSATPRHRLRSAGGAFVGSTSLSSTSAYAVTGRDGRRGFLQRLAVHPAAQRRGLGLALVADSLGWMARWRVTSALVNTALDNDAALELYDRTGFVRLPTQLRVYERSLT